MRETKGTHTPTQKMKAELKKMRARVDHIMTSERESRCGVILPCLASPATCFAENHIHTFLSRIPSSCVHAGAMHMRAFAAAAFHSVTFRSSCEQARV